MTTKLNVTEATVSDMEERLTMLSDELEMTRKQCKEQKEAIDKLKASDKEREEEKKSLTSS